MRYIADSDGYVKEVSFGADITCDGTSCTEYTGSVPTGYTSLEAWYLEEVEKLYRWKIVDGQLTLDSTAVAPGDLTHAEMLRSLGFFKELWRNPDPFSSFGEAQVTLSERADMYILIANTSSDIDYEVSAIATSLSTTIKGCFRHFSPTSGATVYHYSREFYIYDYPDGLTVLFDPCYRKKVATESAGSENNGYLIPKVVYGINGLVPLSSL